MVGSKRVIWVDDGSVMEGLALQSLLLCFVVDQHSFALELCWWVVRMHSYTYSLIVCFIAIMKNEIEF